MRFLKFTAQQMRFKLMDMHDTRLDQFLVSAKDRVYQFWERNSLSIDLWSPEVFMQKLDYIHQNPLQDKWRLIELPEDYKYSSAKFYYMEEDEFGFLTHFNGQCCGWYCLHKIIRDLLVTTPTKAGVVMVYLNPIVKYGI